jgi:hypothetical protein
MTKPSIVLLVFGIENISSDDIKGQCNYESV